MSQKTFKSLNKGKSIQEAFEEFHQNNPEVYAMIKKEAMKAIQAGKKKISIKAICNWLRWEMEMKTVDKAVGQVATAPSGKAVTKGMKINDAYTSRYARKFASDYPTLSNFIEMRDLRDSGFSSN